MAVPSLSIVIVTLLRSYILTTADLVALSRRLWDGDEDGMAEEGPKAGTAVRTPDDGGRGTGAPSTPEIPGDPNAAKVNPKGKVPFLKRCALIGEYYGLTKREVDVFRLLAAGRNSARIQEELMISAGTVNTHSHHVFQKMGVHCQQEVIDLFEKADLDAIVRELGSRGA